MATTMQPLNCYRYVVYTMNDFFLMSNQPNVQRFNHVITQ